MRSACIAPVARSHSGPADDWTNGGYSPWPSPRGQGDCRAASWPPPGTSFGTSGCGTLASCRRTPVLTPRRSAAADMENTPGHGEGPPLSQAGPSDQRPRPWRHPSSSSPWRPRRRRAGGVVAWSSSSRPRGASSWRSARSARARISSRDSFRTWALASSAPRSSSRSGAADRSQPVHSRPASAAAARSSARRASPWCRLAKAYAWSRAASAAVTAPCASAIAGL